MNISTVILNVHWDFIVFFLFVLLCEKLKSSERKS